MTILTLLIRLNRKVILQKVDWLSRTKICTHKSKDLFNKIIILMIFVYNFLSNHRTSSVTMNF